MDVQTVVSLCAIFTVVLGIIESPSSSAAIGAAPDTRHKPRNPGNGHIHSRGMQYNELNRMQGLSKCVSDVNQIIAASTLPGGFQAPPKAFTCFLSFFALKRLRLGHSGPM